MFDFLVLAIETVCQTYLILGKHFLLILDGGCAEQLTSSYGHTL